MKIYIKRKNIIQTAENKKSKRWWRL